LTPECVVSGDAGYKRQISADNAAVHEVICNKKLPDGSMYSVNIQQLKKSLSKVRAALTN